MYTWLCRVMAVIFTFNILSPAYAQTPRSRRKIQMPGEAALARARGDVAQAGARVDSLYNARSQYYNDYKEQLQAAKEAFLAASTPEEVDEAYRQLDSLRRTGSGVMSNYGREVAAAVQDQLNAGSVASFEYYRQNPHVAPDAISQTMGYDVRAGSINPKHFPFIASNTGNAARSAGCPTSAEFLEKLKNNKFESMEEMLDYLDPLGLNCSDYLAVAYAAETLYYAVEEFTRPESVPAEQAEELKVFFAHAQKRASESLKRLNTLNAKNAELYAARGTLRILLAFLQKAVEENNLPLGEKTLYFAYPTKAAYNQAYPKPKPMTAKRQVVGDGVMIYQISGGGAWAAWSSRPSYEDFARQNSYFYETRPTNLPANWKVEEVTLSSLESNPRAQEAADTVHYGVIPPNALYDPMAVLTGRNEQERLGNEFLQELRDFKTQNPSADSQEFALLSLDMQYAAQFAVLTGNDAMLSQMVEMFEEKPGTNIRGEYSQYHTTDFKTKYSDVLSILFNSVYETLNGFNVSRTYMSVFMFLMEMAGPAHATDTRILALGTLGMLTQPTDSISETALRAEFLSIDGETTNKYWLSYEDRFQLALYVADIYAPLQSTSNYGMEDYGLNAEQMLALSDQLSGIYMNFLPMEAPTVTLGPCMKVEKMDMDNRTIITRGTFINQRQGYFVDGNCPFHYTEGGTFVFKSTGTVEMLLDNHINWKKKEKESVNKGMEILGESLLWVFGGAIIGGVFRGLRLLAGVARSLPRAIRAGKIAYNTTKGTRVWRTVAALKRGQASLKVGAKYMTQGNFEAYLARNGMAYTVEHTPVKPGLVPTTSAVTPAGAPRIPPPTTRVTATAADAYSGLARTRTFGVYPEGLAGMPVPVQRAQFLRFLQQNGMRNEWTAVERAAWNRSLMFRNGANELFSNGYTMGNLADGYYPGLFLTNHPVLSAVGKSYWNTVKFFYGFKAFDTLAAMTYKQPFDRWMAHAQEEAVNAEMATHGDSLSPEALAELEAQNGSGSTAAPSDIMASVGGNMKEGFSWLDALTFPSWAWQQFAPAEPDAVDGASILPPFMYGKYALASMGVGSDPFMTDAMRTQIALNAHRVDLTRARIGRINTQLNQGTQAILTDIQQAKATLSSEFAELRTAFPGNWNAEERAFNSLYTDYEAEVRAAEKITNLNDRSKKLGEINEKYAGKIEDLNARVVLHRIRIEKAQLTEFFVGLKQNFPGDWSAEERDWNSLYTDYEAEVRALSASDNKSGTLEEVNKKYSTKIQELNTRISNKQNQMLLAQVAQQGEEAFFTEKISSYEQGVNNTILQLKYSDAAKHYPTQLQTFIEGYERAGADFIATLRRISAKKVLFLNKYVELQDAEAAFETKIQQLEEAFMQSVAASQANEGSRPAITYSDMNPE